MRFQRGGPVCRASTFFCLLFMRHVLKRIRLRIFPRGIMCVLCVAYIIEILCNKFLAY